MLKADKSCGAEEDLTETGESEEGQVEISFPRGKGGKKRGTFFFSFSRESAKKNIQHFFLISFSQVLPLAPIA